MDQTPHIDPRPAIRANISICGLDPELVTRWLSKTNFDPATGCLNWTDKPNTYGYGVLNWKGNQLRAHQIGCELRHGPRGDKYALHGCKQNRLCVNPDHLRLGTQAENVADAVADGTAGRPPGRAYTDADITIVMGLRLLGFTATKIREATGASLSTIQAVTKGKQRPNAISDELDRITGADDPDDTKDKAGSS